VSVAVPALAGLDYPPAAFHFAVNIGVPTPLDSSFQEVSGLDQTLDTEEFVEGGENRFVHQLPKGVKQGRLSLKRGVAALDSPLMAWCKWVLEGGLSDTITTQQVLVHLLDGNGLPLRIWCCHNAFPVHWDIDPFGSMKNEVAVEQIELAYQYCTRML